MHYYQFNIGDYASHTRHLSPLEDIAYRRILDLAYSTELPITKDLHSLCRAIDMREHRQEVEDVLKEFFLEVDDGWINNRVCKEIAKTGEKSDKAKHAAAMRWDSKRKANAMQLECERNANALKSNADASFLDATHYPLPITQDPRPKKKPKPLPAEESAEQELCKETWKRYSLAYQSRYSVLPVRNATVNSQIKGFCKRIGSESPDVAGFFLTHNGSFYVTSLHGVNLLLRDAEKLRTEWATGNTMMRSNAVQIDKTQSRLNVAQQAMQIMSKGKLLEGIKNEQIDCKLSIDL